MKAQLEPMPPRHCPSPSPCIRARPRGASCLRSAERLAQASTLHAVLAQLPSSSTGHRPPAAAAA